MKLLKCITKYVVAPLLVVAVLTPTVAVKAGETKSPAPTEFPTQKGEQDIVTLASSDENLSTLVAALKAAGLVDALEGEGPFTVFAPTNAAFNMLPKDTLDKLLEPKNKEQLENILTYHVFSGNVPSATAEKLNGKEITMLNGKPARISVRNGVLYINNARVVTKDVKASNGVIHVIDMVLLPEK